MTVKLIACTHVTTALYELAVEKGWTVPDATDSEILIEAAGRGCYESWSNKSGKTNTEYIQHILECGHLSVLEHSTSVFFAEGISRSLTHELVRHRHLGVSQLSQRFCGWDGSYVVPPAMRGMADGGLVQLWGETGDAHRQYQRWVEELEQQGAFSHISNTTERRKRIREAARAVVPNCAETKLVVSGNLRAWRHVLMMRGAPGADLEFREFMVEVLGHLQKVAPSVFADFDVYTHPDGFPAICSSLKGEQE